MEFNTDIRLENESLKKEFKLQSLDLDAVWYPAPDNLELENRQLLSLLEWVDKYRELKSRKKMMEEGYHFPPIDPDIDPDSDWSRFELWMNGKPTSFKLLDVVPSEFLFENPDQLSDGEIKSKIERLTDFLASRHIIVGFRDTVPERLIYEHLLEEMREEFDFPVEFQGSYHLDGCHGCCPSCFQRPWCEAGITCCWPEDEKSGEMCITDSAKRYLSSSKISLSILRECQKKEDEAMRKYPL